MADFATAKIEQTGPNTYHVSHGSDANIWVEFFNESVHQPAQSEKEGRPVYKDTPYIKMLFPGDKTKAVCRPATLESQDGITPPDTVRFPKQWAAFQAQQQNPVQGMPIQEWPVITKSEAAEMKAINVFSVEQLAAMPDSSLTWHGARTLRDKAKAWLDQANGGKEAAALAKENQDLKTDVEMLKKQIEELSKKIKGDKNGKDE